jgi:hypothetical protein
MTAELVPKQLKKLIEFFLRRQFVTPFIDSIREPMIWAQFSNAFVLLDMSEQLILEFDKKQGDAGETIEAVREKTLFLGYLGKIYKSALLLIGTTDYVGGIILLRSIFELLIGIATTENSSIMSAKIFSINYLESNEKDNLQTLWNELSAWAHPYGKWTKNICPILYGCGQNYHQETFRQCLSYSDQVLDLLLVITIDHFKLNPENYIDKYREISETSTIVEFSRLPMFEKRLTKNP